MGRGCQSAVSFYIEVLIRVPRVPGDESVRQ